MVCKYCRLRPTNLYGDQPTWMDGASVGWSADRHADVAWPAHPLPLVRLNAWMDSCSNVPSCCVRECPQLPVWSLPFAHDVNLEADILERSVIENDTPVKEEGWMHWSAGVLQMRLGMATFFISPAYCVPRMTISLRLTDTPMEIDGVMPRACLLNGKTPALKMTKGLSLPLLDKG